MTRIKTINSDDLESHDMLDRKDMQRLIMAMTYVQNNNFLM